MFPTLVVTFASAATFASVATRTRAMAALFLPSQNVTLDLRVIDDGGVIVPDSDDGST